ncbi:ATP-binding protein [Methanoculleus sp.]|uniref:ATP-binding protein n=1 Tax=Methanoculleus sp. TaxID=90427 RepID=UPI0025D3C0DB|nr:ATP-binding protein [Methanoculleus sp.]MCK9319129.1 adenine nucleotide alpha hydrolase family protein [Methanoculleus sp.]MDD2254289.1 ATP-binding protein [Methanoculleus sp.]MDD2786799.1 ATP-binding protein [Methanoculleus sp.]MDD4314407.1 ATP-binding protein [Methanoculleus sp.]MDD4471125.1 ATP-binding protein [Methanoculleus sp.]
MQCSKCRRDAVIYQRYSGLHLCEQHFNRDFEAKAKRAIREHRWIASGDTVAVALSGGKDSSAVLYFLHKLLRERRDVRLMAITVDEGISGYRDPARARAIAENIGVPWMTASFQNEYGITLDEIVGRKGTNLSCSYCGVLRRALMNRLAREHGVTKFACGFNLDDEAQSVLEHVLRGDPDRLTRPMREVEGMVPRIKPFMYIPEREVALYSFLHVEGFDLAGCPYAGDVLQGDVREILDEYTSRHPATKYALVNLGEALREPERVTGEGLRVCEKCGERLSGRQEFEHRKVGDATVGTTGVRAPQGGRCDCRDDRSSSTARCEAVREGLPDVPDPR